MKSFRKEYLQENSIECEDDDWRFSHTYYFMLGISNFYSNVSTEPVYTADITEETLETTAKMYLFMLHCPDRFGTTKSEMNFFEELYREQSKETIISTLGRSEFSVNLSVVICTTLPVQMIATARERKNYKILRTAKYLFRQTAEELQLFSKDLEILSSGLSEIQENEEMMDHYSLLSPCLHNGTEECSWWTELGWF